MVGSLSYISAKGRVYALNCNENQLRQISNSRRINRGGARLGAERIRKLEMSMQHARATL
jgi:hypothetical protein